MTRLFLSVLLGVLLGGGLVWWGTGERRAEPSAPVMPVEDEVGAAETLGDVGRLREQLDQERARASELSARVSALEVRPEPEHRPAAESEAQWEEPGEEGEADSSFGRPWFNAEALAAAGWTAEEIYRIRARWEQYELDRLEVKNQRARKVPGWEKLGGRSFQIESETRHDLGDEGYEAMRFATNQPNRVVLEEILETSPAAEAGLLPGDELISYAGQRVFTPGAVQFLTASGELGAWTEIRILRGGEELRFFVPRGPLGARLEAIVRAPYR